MRQSLAATVVNFCPPLKRKNAYSPRYTTNTFQRIKKSLPALLEHHFLQVDRLLQRLEVLFAPLGNDDLWPRPFNAIKELYWDALNLATGTLSACDIARRHV